MLRIEQVLLGRAAPVWALVMMLIGAALVGVVLEQRVRGTLAAGQIRHDSLHYYQDALYIQHRYFGVPADKLIAQLEEASHREYDKLVFDRGKSVFFAFQNAILLQAFGGGVRTLFWSNLVMFCVAVGLALYVAARSAGLLASVAALVWLLMTYEGGQIPTVMAEPAVAFWLAVLAWSAWSALRGRRYGYIVFAVAGYLCMFYKAVLIVAVLAVAMVLGGAVACRWWRFRRHRWLAICVGAVLLPMVYAGAFRGTLAWMAHGMQLNPKAVGRSNMGYAIWVGSLPPRWTGCYSGRINTRTFSACYDPAYRDQYDDVVRRYAVYHAPVRVAWPCVLANYRHYLWDGLSCFSYRYTQMVGLSPIGDRLRCVGAALALLGGGLLLLRRQTLLLVAFLLWQGPVWIHSLSRYRARDDDQVVILVALFAGLGLVWGLRWLWRVVLRKRPWLFGQRSAAPASRRDDHRVIRGVVRRMPVWLAALLSLALLVPLGGMMLNPDILSTRPPQIQECTVRVTPTEPSQLVVTARLDDAHLFARLVLPDRSAVYQQADEQGHVRIEVPFDPQMIGPGQRSMQLQAWSRTEVMAAHVIEEVELPPGLSLAQEGSPSPDSQPAR